MLANELQTLKQTELCHLTLFSKGQNNTGVRSRLELPKTCISLASTDHHTGNYISLPTAEPD